VKKTLEEIFQRELARIEEASKNGPLDIDDLKKVEILTRSLKQIEDPIEKDKELDWLTNDQLLALANLSKRGLDGKAAEERQRTDSGSKKPIRGKNKSPSKVKRGSISDRKESKE
jgi:hypothetical protein